MTIKVELGDICTAQVDVVVNPANEWLRHGAGVAGALNKATGGRWQRVCETEVKLDGTIKPLYGCHFWEADECMGMPFGGILSVVGPRNQGQSVDVIYAEIRAVACTILNYMLNVYEFRGDKSVAIPAISSGLFGCPVRVVAKALFEVAQHYPELDIRFRNFDIPTCKVFAEVCGVPYEEVP